MPINAKGLEGKDEVEIEVNDFLDDEQKNLNEKPEILIRLTRQEISDKKKELNQEDSERFKWAKETHLECLKTELIYNELLLAIENHKLLDLNEREVV